MVFPWMTFKTSDKNQLEHTLGNDCAMAFMLMQSNHRFLTVCFVTCMLGVGGCGSDGLPKYAAKGTVKFADGSPLSGAMVQFRPISQSLRKDGNARGNTGPDGSFQLSTLKPGDGAIATDFQVAINPPLPAGDMDEIMKSGGRRPVISPRFEDFETSGLEFTVSEDESSNNFEIVVERPSGRSPR